MYYFFNAQIIYYQFYIILVGLEAGLGQNKMAIEEKKMAV